MSNQLQEFNKTINLSLEPVKLFRKRLSELIELGKTETRDLDDLHLVDFGFIKNLKLTPDLAMCLSWSPEPSLPFAKDNMGVIRSGTKIYTIGGRTSIGEKSLFQSEDSLVQVYDLDAKEWVTKQRMLYPHTGNSAVVASNGKIYSIGGYLKLPKNISPEDYPLYNDIFSSNAISNFVQEYNPITDAWQKRMNLPVKRVFSTAVATKNGSIYVFGGYENIPTWPDPYTHFEPNTIITANKTYKYSVADDIWIGVAFMPTPRSGAVAVLGKDDKIYVMGGWGIIVVIYRLLRSTIRSRIAGIRRQTCFPPEGFLQRLQIVQARFTLSAELKTATV